MLHNMTMMNARLPLLDEDVYYRLEVREGKWYSIEPQPAYVNERTDEYVSLDAGIGGKIDLEGKIVLPGLVDSHMHLDKAFSLTTVPNRSGTLEEASANYTKAAAAFTKEEIKSRIIRAALQALSYGTTTIRSHLDYVVSSDTRVAMNTYEAAIEAKQLLAPYMTIQFIAMTPLKLNPTTIAGLDRALQMGIDGIGGAPHMCEQPEFVMEECFRLAVKHRAIIDFHADETDDPSVRTVEYIANCARKIDSPAPIMVGHLCALAAMTQEDAAQVIDTIATSGLHVVSLPAVNLYLQGRHDHYPIRRGVTRIKELQAAGIPVAIGSDNIHDPFHPFGRGDLLQISLIAAYAAHMGSAQDLRNLLKMITEVPAHTLGLSDYGFRAGNRAQFVIIDSRSVEQLFTMLPERRWVYSGQSWLRVAPALTGWHEPTLTQLWNQAHRQVTL